MILPEFWENQSLFKNLYSQCIESVCEQHGLTRMEFDILLFLANNPQFDTASDIIEIRHLTKSHVSTSIKSLEQRGYLVKSYTPSNRKTAHLTLCPLAAPAVSAGKAAQEKFVSIIFDGFSPEDRTNLQQFFSRIASNIHAHLTDCSS